MSEDKKLKTDTALSKKALQLDYSFSWDVDFDNRIIRISGDIEYGVSFSIFDAKITELESINRKTITIRINSGGGSVYEALAIIGRMKASTCNLVTEGYGHIMSAATAILAAGNKRKISPFAHFMHHESEYYVEGSHTHVTNEVEQNQKEEEQWAALMGDLTEQPSEYWLEITGGKNVYYSAEECLDLGIVDEII